MARENIPQSIKSLMSEREDKVEFYKADISYSGIKKTKQLLLKFPPRTLAERHRQDLIESIICQEDCQELSNNYVYFALEFPDTCMYTLPLFIKMKRAAREERFGEAATLRDQIKRYQDIATPI